MSAKPDDGIGKADGNGGGTRASGNFADVERRVPLDLWSREWALAHAKKASKRLLEVEIVTYEALGAGLGDSETKHLEILRAELRRRPSA